MTSSFVVPEDSLLQWLNFGGLDHLHGFHGGSVVESRAPSEQWLDDVVDVRLEVAAPAKYVLVLGIVDPDVASLTLEPAGELEV
jgi:hypothetical protein